MTTHMECLEAIVRELPEAERVDIEAWGGEPTFRVRGKNFVFSAPDATSITIKLSQDEAAAVVASDERAEPSGYGLGRHGWISLSLESDPKSIDWDEIREWVRTSYSLVAPRRLSAVVIEEDTDG